MGGQMLVINGNAPSVHQKLLAHVHPGDKARSDLLRAQYHAVSPPTQDTAITEAAVRHDTTLDLGRGSGTTGDRAGPSTARAATEPQPRAASPPASRGEPQPQPERQREAITQEAQVN
ncbi:MAG: hypothetical protein M1817_004967 [Caeruleum heppii]|nr:MAG: hypothetical protein M1817_004967 [Caeruleum heppii]